MAIEINGVLYEPIERETRKPYKGSKTMTMLTTMAYTLGGLGAFGENMYARGLSKNIDLIKEYGLIQLKKSSLSSWERKEVTRLFECKFKKV